ncbi:uncharacterized protein MYCFIDRAFT_209112 [Pseudocercospora fijiensis CIRAD86]|uniref:Uncharacterized protein n=1 Tax=Pseudocercospora fijiensis (strain CIRAD86) TaxID=383855 RepID=M3AK33_PSEFD|nr:uncharacterized protein MYCFIDRAFT_209112 [Pseudocercospora fijiensis CIRAD86]EME77533.1 hypothetical protein MYCFIDRAFT_209112 [Pseudocercospora fijiensis CIRAD86]
MLPPRSSAVVIIVLFALTISSVAGTWIIWIWNGGFQGFQDAMAASGLPDGVRAALEYSGVAFLDDYMRRCVFMTMPVVARVSKQALWGRPLILLSVVDLSSFEFVVLIEADRRGRQHGNSRMQTLWGSSPLAKITVQILLYLAIATPGRGSNEVKMTPSGHSSAQRILSGSAIISSLIHGAALCYVLFNPDMTLWDLHIPSLDEVRGVQGYSSTCLTFMKFDYVLSAAAILVIAYHVLAVQFPYHGLFLELVGLCCSYGVGEKAGALDPDPVESSSFKRAADVEALQPDENCVTSPLPRLMCLNKIARLGSAYMRRPWAMLPYIFADECTCSYVRRKSLRVEKPWLLCLESRNSEQQNSQGKILHCDYLSSTH